ncbi:MAG: MotA/TolQ/ExbB proton channel family protein [Planctomycetia bacterium]|nr:MotA/TolQ/ExbB proton channel family protein [Planctomycetia bacterium]
MKRMFATFLGSPILWGGLCGIGFYAAIRRGLLDSELITRYCAGHPVEYITVFMFFIGMASLALKWMKNRKEGRRLALGPVFAPPKGLKESLDTVDDYLATLKKAGSVRGQSIYLTRLAHALNFLKFNGDPNELDQELRFLSEEDQYRADAEYGMVRMFIWAIPILGFLGTVIGITMALGNLDLTELETTGKLLAAGLQVAFDTTALALSLVFLLYFSLFFVRGQEAKYFADVDRMADHELKGRFASGQQKDADVATETVRQAMQSVIESFDLLMKRQTALWSEAITGVNERAARISSDSVQKVETAMIDSLRESMIVYSRGLIDGQKKLLDESVAPLVAALEKKTEKLGSFKDQMMEESKLLLEVVRATGEVTRLEDRLNQNLKALAGVGNFEETVNSLAATIHLLNSKLNGLPQTSEIRLAASPETPQIKEPRPSKGATVIPLSHRPNDTRKD